MSEESLLGSGAVPVAEPAAALPTDGGPIEQKAAPAISMPENWKDILAEDLRADPSMKHINDVGALAKSYVHAQRQMGADKITVPSKHATEDEWRAAFSKLGLPDSMDKYELNPVKGNPTDDEVFSKFKEIAYQNSLLPHQAQKVYDWYNGMADEMVRKQQIENQAIFDEKLQGLKQEWGDAFADKVQLAQGAVLHVGGEELKNYMNESGLGNDTVLIKAFAKVAEVLGEDQFKDGRIFTGGFSVEDSKQKVEQTMGDPKSPYFDKTHPGHAAMVKEMSQHFENLNKAKPRAGFAITG